MEILHRKVYLIKWHNLSIYLFIIFLSPSGHFTQFRVCQQVSNSFIDLVFIERSFGFDGNFCGNRWLFTLVYFWLISIEADVRIVSFSYYEQAVVNMFGALSSSKWMLDACYMQTVTQHLMRPRKTHQSIKSRVNIYHKEFFDIHDLF